MNDFKDQKEMKMAMSGRMGLMAGGILLVFTAVTSTLMYAVNFFSLASGASNGDAECLDVLSQANVSISLIRTAAICFLIAAIAELLVGAVCAVFCNRIDKAKFTVRLSAFLLGLEILLQVFLFLTRMLNISLLLTAIVIPAYLLWSSTRLLKLSKLYPDRSYALKTKRDRERQHQAAQAQAEKKSLHERAMMNNSKLRWDAVQETGNTAQNMEHSADPEPSSAEDTAAEENDSAQD